MLSYANSKDATVSLSSHFFNSQTISTKPMENVVYGKTTDGIELKMDVWPAKETSKQIKACCCTSAWRRMGIG